MDSRRYVLRWIFRDFSCKEGCIFQMVVSYIPPHAGSGPNDHLEDASHFIFQSSVMTPSSELTFSLVLNWLLTYAAYGMQILSTAQCTLEVIIFHCSSAWELRSAQQYFLLIITQSKVKIRVRRTACSKTSDQNFGIQDEVMVRFSVV